MQLSTRDVCAGIALVLAVGFGNPAPAWAQAARGAAGASLAEATPDTPAEGRRTRDAASNRGLLFPVAETTPQGDFEISDYELIFLTLAYGATDRLQISLTTILPLVEGQPFFLWLTGKYAVYRSDTLVFSPLMSFDFFTAEGENALLWTVGAMVDFILGDRGQGAISLGLFGSFLLASPASDAADLDTFDNSALMLNTSFTWEVAKIVKLLLEVDIPAAIADGEFDIAEGVLINYGVRFFNDMFAGDIGFIRPVGGDSGDFILGLPVGTFTVRF